MEYRNFEEEEKARQRKNEMKKDDPEELNKVQWTDTDSGSKMNKFDKEQQAKKKRVSYYNRQPKGS
jgi:hypothetical protein